MELVEAVYRLMDKMPKEEMYSLTSQLKRCSVSIPSNIAEGAGRNTAQEFARFLDISNGSANELETQLLLSNRLKYLTDGDIEPVLKTLESIQKMNYKLIKSLR